MPTEAGVIFSMTYPARTGGRESHKVCRGFFIISSSNKSTGGALLSAFASFATSGNTRPTPPVTQNCGIGCAGIVQPLMRRAFVDSLTSSWRAFGCSFKKYKVAMNIFTSTKSNVRLFQLCVSLFQLCVSLFQLCVSLFQLCISLFQFRRQMCDCFLYNEFQGSSAGGGSVKIAMAHPV